MPTFNYGSSYFWDKVVLTKFISRCPLVWDLICGTLWSYKSRTEKVTAGRKSAILPNSCCLFFNNSAVWLPVRDLQKCGDFNFFWKSEYGSRFPSKGPGSWIQVQFTIPSADFWGKGKNHLQQQDWCWSICHSPWVIWFESGLRNIYFRQRY